MSKYLDYRLVGCSPSGKTEVWDVLSRATGSKLGTIKWFGRWRQYSFFPEAGTTFNPDCLRSIADEVAGATKPHREPPTYGDWRDAPGNYGE